MSQEEILELDLSLHEPLRLSDEPVVFAVDSSGVRVHKAGGLSFTYYTNSFRFFQCTPFDTLDKVNINNLMPQVQFVLASLLSFTHDDTIELPVLFPTPGDIKYGGFTNFYGQVIEFNFTKAWYDNVPNAIVVFNYIQRGVGQPYTFIIMADENGTWHIHGIPHMNSWAANHQLANRPFEDPFEAFYSKPMFVFILVRRFKPLEVFFVKDRVDEPRN
jgi:hypothetical protein